MTLNGGPGRADGVVLAEVFRHVLAHAGLNGEAGERLLDQVMDERRAAAGGDCTVRFTAHAGELEITLSQAGRDWHTTCPVPIR
jgi:hypothetical protein